MATQEPRPRSRGQAIVEFALIGLMLTTLVFGAIEVGRALWTYIGLTGASRDAARKAANCQNLTPITAYAIGAGGGIIGTPTITVAYYRPTTTAATPPAVPTVTFGTPVSTPALGDMVTITVSTGYTPLAPIVGPIFNNIQLSSSSSAQVEALVSTPSACP